MITAMQSSSETVDRHWSDAAVLVAGLSFIAIASGFAAFAIGSIDLRTTMVVAVVMGIAATVAANIASQESARGAVWLGVWLALAFLFASAFQGFWSTSSLAVPLTDAGLAGVLALINVKFAMIVSRRES